jgi:hypothetical protein
MSKGVCFYHKLPKYKYTIRCKIIVVKVMFWFLKIGKVPNSESLTFTGSSSFQDDQSLSGCYALVLFKNLKLFNS